MHVDELTEVYSLPVMLVGTPLLEIEAYFKLAKRALKLHRHDLNDYESFTDLRFILHSSNTCKQLFPKAGFVLTDSSNTILSTNFDA